MSIEGKSIALEYGENTFVTGQRDRFWRRDPAVGGFAKRSLDILIAVAGLVMLSPLLFMIAASVKLTSRGPVLFGHRRIGARGRVFRCWKFRTMIADSGDALERHLAENPAAREEWERTRKLKNDVRITPIGRILRDYSLDELPQLFNVVKGDMSIVGPRPVVADELSLYGADARYYLSARPGITGLWQVSGRNDVSYDARVALDKAYVRDWSMNRDLRIILKTVPAALSARGAY